MQKLCVTTASNSSGATKDEGSRQGFLTTNGALYIGPTLNSTTHISHAYKIYFALYGQLTLQLADGSYLSPPDSIVVAPDHPHRTVDNGAVIAIFYLIPETTEGRLTSRLNSGRGFFALRPAIVADLARQLTYFSRNGCSPAEAAEASRVLLTNLTPAEGANNVFDRRIKFLIEYLDSALDRRVTVPELAASVALSPSRVEHLFNEQVGIPICQYLLWRRLRRALNMFSAGKTLTEVAYDAGFADSSHLSRTFRRMVGISPSTIMRDVNLFQAGEMQV
jgi:AraC-like DNA-binding protein